MWTLPESSHLPCTLTLGSTRFVVDPTTGGRIIEFSNAGNNVLMPLQDMGGWLNGGSTFWTSPQSDWGWPPVGALDREAYAVTFDRERQRLTLQSREFQLSGSTIAVAKSFSPDFQREAVNIDYRVTNHGPAVKVAGWEISRVAAAGLSFFAGESIRALGGLPEPLSTTSADGVLCMDHQVQTNEAKLGGEATQGFVAYATPSLLFVKRLVDGPARPTAAGEAEIELYVKPHEYVEIEQQSALRLLQPGQSLSYRLTWFLRAMKPDADVSCMNDRLFALAQQVGSELE